MKIGGIFRALAIAVSLVVSTAATSVFFRADVRPSPRHFLECVGLRENRYTHAQKQTVLIRAKDCQGSGVAIRRVDPFGEGRWFVWTAAHVVEQDDSPKVVITIKNDDVRCGEVIFTGHLIARNKDADVALLWVDMPDGYLTASQFDSVPPLPVGTPVYHVGNFLGSAFFGSVSTGVVSQTSLTPGDDWPWLLSDQSTFMLMPGSSGGPVFNGVNEKVCGIAVGIFGRGNLAGVFIPVREVLAVASTEGVEWSVFGTRCPAKSKLSELVQKNRIIPPKIKFEIPLDISGV